MKKLLFLLAVMFPIVLIAQQDSTMVNDIPVPGSIIDVFKDLQGWFGSTTAVAGLTIFITLIISNLWKSISKIMKQVVAIVVAMALIIGGNLANFGFMADFNWLSTIVYGLVTGFMANGLYDLKNIRP
jgi:hypothetical protein